MPASLTAPPPVLLLSQVAHLTEQWAVQRCDDRSSWQTPPPDVGWGGWTCRPWRREREEDYQMRRTADGKDDLSRKSHKPHHVTRMSTPLQT
jgi:hypothetical protein